MSTAHTLADRGGHAISRPLRLAILEVLDAYTCGYCTRPKGADCLSDEVDWKDSAIWEVVKAMREAPEAGEILAGWHTPVSFDLDADTTSADYPTLTKEGTP